MKCKITKIWSEDIARTQSTALSSLGKYKRNVKQDLTASPFGKFLGLTQVEFSLDAYHHQISLTIYLKGLSSKPSGDYIVAPIFCLLS